VTVYLAYYDTGFIDGVDYLLAVCASYEIAVAVIEGHKKTRDKEMEYEDRAKWWVVPVEVKTTAA